MLKQTLEATYDPGALLLNDPNIHFTSARQLFSNVYDKSRNDSFLTKVEIENNQAITTSFKIYPKKAIQLVEMTYEGGGEKFYFHLRSFQQTLLKFYQNHFMIFIQK